MKVFIDGDGCPVTRETVSVCRKQGVECIIICDTSHEIYHDGAKTVVVEKGPDSADFKIVNLVDSGDLVITQDYALAAMCLSRKCRVLNQDGMEYTDSNIDSLLFSRYTSKKIQMAGGRLKGPKKRDAIQTENYIKKLVEIIQEEKI